MIRIFHPLPAAILAATWFAAPTFAQTPVERGAYLVNAVMGCDGCHTPRGPGGFDMSKRFSGGSQVFDEPQFTVKGSNITPDRETGIGAWSDADIRKMMTEGVRPNGVPVGADALPVLQDHDARRSRRGGGLHQDGRAGAQRGASRRTTRPRCRTT